MPSVPWREVLRDFLTRTARNDYRWNRPNRRFVARRLYLPSLAGDSLGDVVVAVDTSGSIGQEELDRFAAEVQGIVDAYDVHLTILYHDTKVTEVEEWSPADGPITLRPIGGGGTSHRRVFKWLEEHGVDPSCMICLTDLQTTFPSESPLFPVLWAVVGDCPEKEVFNNARRLASPEERAAYLQQVCGHEPKALHRILELLNVYFQESSFLGRPAVAPDPNGTAGWETTESASAVGAMIGPYKLLEEIGEGGMGLVFVAEQQQPIKRRVALKIIKPGMDSRQVIARFKAEQQALAMMDHPNIAQVHDGGATPEGRPYFVMELVKGTPITDYCDSHRLTTRQRLQLFLDVCSAVQHAHQKEIIHRDLKPSNVLVSHHDVTPVVKVIDFGIAKATSGRLTDKTL